MVQKSKTNNQNKVLIEICSLDINLYKCITSKIATDRVVLTEKSLLHMSNSHPDAYENVLASLSETVFDPDYIIKDECHDDTGLVIKEIHSSHFSGMTIIVLKICTNTLNGVFANSILSGWKISKKRLQSYLRNKTILYKKT